jgi:outer membrane protein assembly factor BamA
MTGKRALLRAFGDLWVGLLLLSPCALAAGQEGLQLALSLSSARVRQSVIGEIIVTGTKVLSAASIIAAAGVKEGDPCTDQSISQVITRLVATGNFGMYSQTDAVRAHVEENNPPDGKCRLIIEVDENEPITSVSITGSGPIKPEEIDKLITRGPVYSEKQFLQDAAHIAAMYDGQGYGIVFGPDNGPDAKVRGQLNVAIIVKRVGEITVVGSHRVKSSAILGAMKTRKGDYYNRLQMEKDRARLASLGLFEEIVVEERMLDPKRIGLTIRVKEKPPKKPSAKPFGT